MNENKRVFIVTCGEYEDEAIEYVCFTKDEAYMYIAENGNEEGYYRVYSLLSNTKYDSYAQYGTADDNLVYVTGDYNKWVDLYQTVARLTRAASDSLND